MNIDDDGWISGIRRIPSPNCDSRLPAEPVSLAVIHCISLPEGCFGGPHVEALFTNCLDPCADESFADLAGLRVSAHVVILRDGVTTQYVSLLQRAWHAGESVFDGRARCNDYSVGIELEGTDLTAFTAAQYRVLIPVLRVLMRRFPQITPERIVGHSDIAPTRKTDPGPGFDWSMIRECVTSDIDCDRLQ